MLDEDAIRIAVRERYARAASAGSCCGDTAAGNVGQALPALARRALQRRCCGDTAAGNVGQAAGESSCGGTTLTLHDGRTMPGDIAGASLGCGAPIDAAAPQPGETVVDLGSGAGLDVFLAADRVGPAGRAIGVDMTPEMIARARASAARLGMTNAEFRLGEIERLPVSSDSVDAVISNCVINLLPDKRPAFAEAFRVLRAGGRLIVSDIVSAEPLPAWMRTAERWTACIGGAIPVEEYLEGLRHAGFVQVEILAKRTYAPLLFSATIRAWKPARN